MPKRIDAKTRATNRNIEKFQIEVFQYFLEHFGKNPPRGLSEKSVLKKLRKATAWIEILERRLLQRDITMLKKQGLFMEEEDETPTNQEDSSK